MEEMMGKVATEPDADGDHVSAIDRPTHHKRNDVLPDYSSDLKRKRGLPKMQGQDQGPLPSSFKALQSSGDMCVEMTDSFRGSSYLSSNVSGGAANSRFGGQQPDSVHGGAPSVSSGLEESTKTGNSSFHRPRKHCRGTAPNDSELEADRKKNLMEKLQSYENCSHDDYFTDDDDGDVSGEDVFSDDEFDANRAWNDAGKTRVSRPSGSGGRFSAESHQRTLTELDSSSEGIVKREFSPSHLANGEREICRIDQQNIGYQSSMSAQSDQRYPSHARDQAHASRHASNNCVSSSRLSKSGKQILPESSRDIFSRMHSNMMAEQHKYGDPISERRSVHVAIAAERQGKPSGYLPTGYKPYHHPPQSSANSTVAFRGKDTRETQTVPTLYKSQTRSSSAPTEAKIQGKSQSQASFDVALGSKARREVPTGQDPRYSSNPSVSTAASALQEKPRNDTLTRLNPNYSGHPSEGKPLREIPRYSSHSSVSTAVAALQGKRNHSNPSYASTAGSPQGKPMRGMPVRHDPHSSQSSASTTNSLQEKRESPFGHNAHAAPPSFHTRSSSSHTRPMDPRTLSTKALKSRSVFVDLESEIMSKDFSLDHSHDSTSVALSSRTRRRNIEPNGSSSTFCETHRGIGQHVVTHHNFTNEASLPRGGGGMPTIAALPDRQYTHHPKSLKSPVDFHRRILSDSKPVRCSREAVATTASNRGSYGNPDERSCDLPQQARGAEGATSAVVTATTLNDNSRKQSLNIVANMEAVMLRQNQDAPSESKGTLDRSFQRRALSTGEGSIRTSSLKAPSREVIANMEADIMRLEEEEDRMETENQGRGHPIGDPRGHYVMSGLTHSTHQPAGMNQRNSLSIMMMKQQHRQHQQQRNQSQRTSSNSFGYSIADQISNMAIDPLRLEAHLYPDGDDSSCKSINSYISYDGKCTNIHASRTQTSEQELVCHALNDAICDLYGAPVGAILRQYPMVTRLIRADDETGNVQLHYAVRNGNIKAIRRIVRADPGCALIRNIQGCCPLHLAVQIGNYAAVQLLCCIVPASAEVQCEEGCLPLHEAVSSAAHLPDAPQITAALINAFPSAIKITNDEGLLPLHLAAMSGFSAGIRTIFAFGFSTIYARENTEEMLPLDFAIEGYITSIEEANEAGMMGNESITSNIPALTESAMEFRQCIDIFLMSALYGRPVFTPGRSEQRGMTFLPIHGAAAAQPCSTSWNMIISMYGREYASNVDVRGRTALHILVTSPQSHPDVVTKMIIDINELDHTSSTTFDDGGLIPLHAALMHFAPYAVVLHLLMCNWSTVSVEVDEGCDNEEFHGMLPFQLAAACGCSVEIVNLLLRAHPTGIAGAL